VSAPPISLSDPGQVSGPPVKRTRGLPTTDKHYLLWASGSFGLKCLAQRDVAVGTHTRLTIHTQVWIPSHRRLTLLDQGCTPEYHHDSARG
jgi:hypothetical protein